jgi:hypothetical protein
LFRSMICSLANVALSGAKPTAHFLEVIWVKDHSAH